MGRRDLDAQTATRRSRGKGRATGPHGRAHLLLLPWHLVGPRATTAHRLAAAPYRSRRHLLRCSATRSVGAGQGGRAGREEGRGALTTATVRAPRPEHVRPAMECARHGTGVCPAANGVGRTEGRRLPRRATTAATTAKSRGRAIAFEREWQCALASPGTLQAHQHKAAEHASKGPGKDRRLPRRACVNPKTWRRRRGRRGCGCSRRASVPVVVEDAILGHGARQVAWSLGRVALGNKATRPRQHSPKARALAVNHRRRVTGCWGSMQGLRPAEAPSRAMLVVSQTCTAASALAEAA